MRSSFLNKLIRETSDSSIMIGDTFSKTKENTRNINKGHANLMAKVAKIKRKRIAFGTSARPKSIVSQDSSGRATMQSTLDDPLGRHPSLPCNSLMTLGEEKERDPAELL